MRQYQFCNKKCVNFGITFYAEIPIWMQSRFDGFDFSATLSLGLASWTVDTWCLNNWLLDTWLTHTWVILPSFCTANSTLPLPLASVFLPAVRPPLITILGQVLGQAMARAGCNTELDWHSSYCCPDHEGMTGAT